MTLSWSAEHSDLVVVAAAVAGSATALCAEWIEPAHLVACLVAALLVMLPWPWSRRPSRRSAVVAAAFVCAFCALVGGRAMQDLSGLDAPTPGTLEGSAQLGSDPVTGRFGTSVEVVMEGRRWLAVAERSTEWVLLELRSGDRVHLVGTVSSLEGAPQGWVRARHLAGRLRISEATALGAGQPWFVAANEVHRLLERGAASMEGQHRALYLGLVVGDDRAQDEMTEFRFRASGLTHLLAVSGQNMAFVLVALSPLLRRLPTRWRWILGTGAIGAFMVVTRAEPSVLRAGTMASLALVATTLGRRASGIRLVSLAVCILVVMDPLLVHSVGFRLSVAATTSLVLFAGPLADWLPGPRFVAQPLAVTLAAQVGAIPVMALTFGPTSIFSVVANLLAGPAAAVVMTLGMTTGVLSGVVREEIAWVLQIPVRAGVWWIDSVARSTSSLSAPPLTLQCWVLLAVCGAISVALLRGVRPRAWFPARRFRRRLGPAPGRALVALVVPLVLVSSPPAASTGPTGEEIALGSDAKLIAVCGTWWLQLAPGPPEGYLDPDAQVGLVEALWTLGLSRVEAVSGTGASRLAPILHATVVAELPTARGALC